METAINTKDTSFYKVPIICLTAPEIGYGNSTDLVWFEVEKDDSNHEAWLNRIDPACLIKFVLASRKEVGTGH